MSTKLPPGVRVVDRMMKASPGTSVARMTAEQLERVQSTVIPEQGLASLVLGRRQRGVEVRTASFPARHGALPLRLYVPEAWSRTSRPVVLNFHGGGFVLGSARQCDWSCSILAKELDASWCRWTTASRRGTGSRPAWRTATTPCSGPPRTPRSSAGTRAGSV